MEYNGSFDVVCGAVYGDAIHPSILDGLIPTDIFRHNITLKNKKMTLNEIEFNYTETNCDVNMIDTKELNEYNLPLINAAMICAKKNKMKYLCSINAYNKVKVSDKSGNIVFKIKRCYSVKGSR